jgi:hypothetical protein
MEGWFWRFTDAANGRVVVALCGINRHADGDWATVALAEHPSGWVRSAVVSAASASDTTMQVEAPGALRADDHTLRVTFDDVQLEVDLDAQTSWPLRLGGGGIFSMLPFLGQYWHPHILGGRARGAITIGDERISLDGADVYAEKNWGAGFPDEWWWGQAQGFTDASLCVAFGGGRLTAGPVALNVTGCVVRYGDHVVRFAPPLCLVRCHTDSGRWSVSARKPGWRVSIEADGNGNTPAVLPVPLPSERRNVDRDFEHLAGRFHLRVWRRGELVVDDESQLAALEQGSTDPDRAARIARSLGLGVDEVSGSVVR